MPHPDYLPLTSYQMAEWQAYNVLEPISLGQHVDTMGALVTAMIANVNRDPKKRDKPFTVAEFLIPWDPEEAESARRAQEPTAEDLYLKASAWALLGVGQIEDGGAD